MISTPHDDIREHFRKLLVTAVAQIAAEGRKPKAAGVKALLQRLSNGGFDEKRLGYLTFRQFLTDAERDGLVLLRAAGDDLEVLPGPATALVETTVEAPTVGENQVVRHDLWRAWVEWSPAVARTFDRVAERALTYPAEERPFEDESYAALRKAMAENPTRFVAIPGIGQEETLRQMKHFALGIDVPGVREDLLQALRGDRPAAQFSRVVRIKPAIGKAWHRARAQHVVNAIARWAAENGVPLKDYVVDSTPQSSTEKRPGAGVEEREDTQLQDARARVLAAIGRMPTSELLQIRIPAEYLLF